MGRRPARAGRVHLLAGPVCALLLGMGLTLIAVGTGIGLAPMVVGLLVAYALVSALTPVPCRRERD